ncbi:MAG: hypothetical protein ACREMX_18280 [Gemmatimonadales bacterium]
MNSGERQARLKPEFAHLYPGIPPGEWQPAAVMADRVLALRLQAGKAGEVLRDRALSGEHFEYRGALSGEARDRQTRSRRGDPGRHPPSGE